MLLNVLFFGSSEYCLPILDTINKNFQLSAIITKENSASKAYAQSHNIKHYTPKDKSELLALKNDLTLLNPDIAIVADYGLLIPKEIFDLPKYKSLNIHFSCLPKFRGPSPVQYTILSGEKSAWISVIILGEEIDTGDIVWQKEIKMINNETTGTLYKKLFDIAALEIPDIINKYVRNELKPQKQDHTKASYTRHFTRQDGFIPWQIIALAIKGIQPTKEELNKWPLYELISLFPFSIFHFPLSITRALHALSPWPGMWTEIFLPEKMTNRSDRLHLSSSTKRRLKILKAHLEPLASQGQPLQGYRLVLDHVQLEGKKPVSWKQFLEGYPNIF